MRRTRAGKITVQNGRPTLGDQPKQSPHPCYLGSMILAVSIVGECPPDEPERDVGDVRDTAPRFGDCREFLLRHIIWNGREHETSVYGFNVSSKRSYG